VTRAQSVRAALQGTRPEVIINCAAFTGVDAAESEAGQAFAVNAVGVKHLREAAEDMGAGLVQISTDYVFDGAAGRPYTEDDVPRPINTYGMSKLAGEYYARMSRQSWVVRVSSLFGTAGRGDNFVDLILRKAKAGEPLRVVDEAVMSPTYAADAADMVARMMRGGVRPGVYHLAGAGHCSWYAFAQAIFASVGWSVNLMPITSFQLARAARRPSCSALVSRRLPSLGFALRPWQEGLRAYLTQRGYPVTADRE